MKYSVIWKRSAENDLASIWIAAANRQAITDAVEALEREAATNPLNLGESREENTRVAFRGPLGIQFEVLDSDRLVTVLAVWNCLRRR